MLSIFFVHKRSVPPRLKLSTDLASKTLIASLSSPTGYIKWEDIPYRGEFIISTAERGDNCDLIGRVPIDSYISTLLAKEMSSDWPLEALKAQAVAARTYALYKQSIRKDTQLSQVYDLENSEKHQVSGSFADETLSTTIAAKETSGFILVNPKGEVRPTFYHSKCGGRTRLPEQVWEGHEDYYEQVDCPYCRNHGQKSWSYSIDTSKYISLFIQKGEKNSSIIQSSSHSGFVQFLPDEKKTAVVRMYSAGDMYAMKKSQLRREFGRKNVKSNLFKLHRQGDKVILEGEGYGHGVGMCQFGAYEMAKRGYSFKQILKFYYPRFKLKKIY